MLELLNHHNGLELHHGGFVANDTIAAKKKILFDQSHGELAGWQPLETSDNGSAWSQLRESLSDEFDWEVFPPLPDFTDASATEATTGQLAPAVPLTDQVLRQYDVLVLAAPTRHFDRQEQDAIVKFVEFHGKSVLIANNYDSLWQDQQHQGNVNDLLQKFGLRARPLLSSPPRQVEQLSQSHYLTGGIRCLQIKEPSYLQILENDPQVLATLPGTGKPFLATMRKGAGQVVAIADFTLFSDTHLKRSDNQLLAQRIFQWLTRQNPIDICGEPQIPVEILYGETAIFSITLSNPSLQNRLENVHCVLESDAGALISDSRQQVRFIPTGGTHQLHWRIEPQQLGIQHLRLAIDFPQTGYNSLFLNPVAEFNCVPDAGIDFMILDQQGNVRESVETGVSFEVRAMVNWGAQAKRVPFQLSLDSPEPDVAIAQAAQDRWQVKIAMAGSRKVCLTTQETQQKRFRLIHTELSITHEIAELERNVVARLAAEVHYRMAQLRPEFDFPTIRNIPFHLYTAEDLARVLYPPQISERLLEVLKDIQTDPKPFLNLLDELLLYIAPTYLPTSLVPHNVPKLGCYVPYAPKLAAILTQKHEFRGEHIAYNLLCVAEDERYGQTWLEGNLAALLLHEKYGHGFFFTHTKLGQQLAILHRYGLLRWVDAQQLKSPYLLSLYQEYKPVIQVLYHSSIEVNEGFAAWLELTVLRQLSGVMQQTAYRREQFLFSDQQLKQLSEISEYFGKFGPDADSRYRPAYVLLQKIQSAFGEDCGSKCAVQAVIKAADVDLGIVEVEKDERIQFGLAPDEMRAALMDDSTGNARSYQRLKQIWQVLEKHQTTIRSEQKRLECHRNCLHAECPVNRIIHEQLGW